MTDGYSSSGGILERDDRHLLDRVTAGIGALGVLLREECRRSEAGVDGHGIERIGDVVEGPVPSVVAVHRVARRGIACRRVRLNGETVCEQIGDGRTCLIVGALDDAGHRDVLRHAQLERQALVDDADLVIRRHAPLHDRRGDAHRKRGRRRTPVTRGTLRVRVEFVAPTRRRRTPSLRPARPQRFRARSRR